jgi:hypothetical protein
MKPLSRKINNNLLRLWESRTETDESEGLLWYARANRRGQELALRHDVTISQALGVIAVLSPGCEWSKNLQYADELLASWNSGKRGSELPMVGVYGNANLNKAKLILSGHDPMVIIPDSSKKVKAFYSCLLRPADSLSVVIDRHAKCAALDLRSEKKGYASKDVTVRSGEYDYLSRHYVKLADRFGLLPSMVQAVLWTSWKRLGIEKGE